MDSALRLRRGQQQLTAKQEAEAERFTQAYMRRLLSTEPVDEAAAAVLLRRAYEVAELAAPRQISWVDGPCQLLAGWFPEGFRDGVHAEPVLRASFWEPITASALEDVWWRVSVRVRQRVEASIQGSRNSLQGRGWDSGNLYDSVEFSVGRTARTIATPNVSELLWNHLEERIVAHTRNREDETWRKGVLASGAASIRVYRDLPDLARYAFFDTYLAPNRLHALAQFHAQVSGYWLGQAVALVVRRPSILSLDEEGRLHSATGPCIAYHDGWGFYAWHGVPVSEQVILAPERLSRDDFLGERNSAARRVIQERMGQRFVPELGGRVLDSGPRGVLYEVELPGDRERVARYVQVQDATTGGFSFLRVPRTIHTAAQAVAWSFQMAGEEYAPVHET